MRPCVAVAALALLASAHGAQGAEGSSLRGLRAPALIDFTPATASPAATPVWEPDGAGMAARGSLPQPSPLYGLRERLPSGSTARLAYSYSDTLTGVIEAGPALQAPYIPAYALSGQLVRSFGSGLGLGLGLRQRQGGDNLVALGVQQGWGPFRGGYTLYSAGTDAAAASHRFALSFSYGPRSSIGLSYTAGRDLHAGLLPYGPGGDSRDWALSGLHWLAPQWALTYDLVNSDQPALRRQGLRFGIRHTF